MSNTNTKTAVQETQKKDDRGVVYEVGGERIALTFATVKNYLVRGDEAVSDQEVVLFMNWCKYNLLNPWNNEAYLIKYDKNKPAQNVTAKGAFMRRAEEHPQYDGFKAGLILAREGEVIEVEGSFMLKTDTLLGGWCDVYRKDRKYPTSARVNLEEYHKSQATWNQMPKTMIRKVAIVQAHREAFPAKLESLYTDEEVQDTEAIDPEKEVEKEIKEKANKTPVRLEAPKERPSITIPETQKEQEAVTVLADPGSGQVSMTGPDF